MAAVPSHSQFPEEIFGFAVENKFDTPD